MHVFGLSWLVFCEVNLQMLQFTLVLVEQKYEERNMVTIKVLQSKQLHPEVRTTGNLK